MSYMNNSQRIRCKISIINIINTNVKKHNEIANNSKTVTMSYFSVAT